jgi:methionyl-tRNA formyltransferase
VPNEQIERMVRAYNPWPGVWTTVGEMAGQLDRELKNPKHQNLKLKILSVHLENGTLSLDQIQVEGKKPISFANFANGYLA